MSVLVDAAWVAERNGKPGFTVVDATLPPVGVVPVVDTHGRYLMEHLPGALFFDIDALSDHTSGLPHTMPSEESFAASMGAMGLSERDTVVVYEQTGVFSAPRALWMLRSLGVQDVRLLQGGIQAWKAAGLPVEAGAVERPPTAFHASLQPKAVTSYAALQRVLAEQGQVLDARSAGRFAGSAPEPRAGLRSGHMPGATSVPFTELVEDGALKEPDALRAMFAAKGVDLSQPITTTCGSGVTAAVVSLGLEVAGAGQVSLYDGSWAEYAQMPDAVIETGA